MTGTGTQADPYIPMTLTEFITAVGTAGAYVTLTQDINAADDPEYSGELTSPININATSVDGAGHFIAGVTVRATRCIYIGVSRYVYNLTIRDFCLKAENISYLIYGEGRDRSGLINCKIAGKIDGLTQIVGSGVAFTSCAADIEITQVTGTLIFSLCAFNKSTFLINGAHFHRSNGAVDRCTFTRSAIIFGGYSDGMYAVFNAGSMSYSYVCFSDAIDATINVGNPGMTGSIVASPDGQTVTAPSSAILATLDQMKDKDWLTSVGFLP